MKTQGQVMTYNNLFPYDNGIIKNISIVDNTRFSNLFTIDDIVSLDTYLNSKIGLRELVPFICAGVTTDNIATKRNSVAKITLDMYYNVWLRVKDVLSTEYNVFDVAVETYSESSTNTSIDNASTNNNIQNKSNSFDDTENDTNTDSVTNDTTITKNNTDNHSMNYRKVSTGALYTPMELLDREIQIREKYNFYDVIVNDVKKFMTLSIY